jgi:mono/diheme cytochrome c family protein
MRPLVIPVLLLLVALAIRSAPASPPAPAAPAAPPAPASDPREATRKAAHDVLAQHCGECHEGHRSKKPEALAIFDLDRPDWPGRFDAHRFQTALGRLDKKPAPASQVFIAFRDAELASSAKHD